MNQFFANYQVPDVSIWTGRMDGGLRARYHKVVKTIDLSKTSSLAKNSISLIGFACDIGVKRNLGFVGAGEGSFVLKKRLASLAFHGSQDKAIYDVGAIISEDDKLEEAQSALSEIVAFISEKHSFPLVIGGGHELAWPHYKGLAESYKRKSIAIVNIDAHFDMRPLENGKGNSGTSFNQIAMYCEKNNLPYHYMAYGIQPEGNTDALFKRVQELKGKYITAEEIHRNPEKSLQHLMRYIEKYDFIYPSICMDVFAQSFAPGVSARSPLGLFPWHILPVVQKLAQSGKVVGLGIAEFAPNRDVYDSTATLVALLIAQFVKNYKPTF